MSSKTLRGNATFGLGHAQKQRRRDACRRTSLFLSKSGFSCACTSSGTPVSAEVGEQEGVARRDDACAQTNCKGLTPSASCCARERVSPCEHPHRPACNLLHTQALQAKVCNTSAAHPQRMLRSNIKCVKIPFSPCMLRFFSEELRSRASSTKQHSAEVSKPSAKTVSAAFHTKKQHSCDRDPTLIPSLPTRKQNPYMVSLTPSASCCARERVSPCEHPQRPACNLLHTQALQAKVCNTSAAHP
jgi:hypothetical protein